MEIFRPIKGFEGKYLVSNMGNVKSVIPYAGTSERLLKQYTNKGGYLFVCLANGKKSVNGKRKTAYKIKDVHRLVAETFIPNPQALPQVNHKDENKRNNTVENLEWCTEKYNVNYGTRNERYSKKVICKTIDGSLVNKYQSVTAAAQAVCGSPGNISYCCRGGLKTAYGYKWEYAD